MGDEARLGDPTRAVAPAVDLPGAGGCVGGAGGQPLLSHSPAACAVVGRAMRDQPPHKPGNQAGVTRAPLISPHVSTTPPRSTKKRSSGPSPSGRTLTQRPVAGSRR